MADNKSALKFWQEAAAATQDCLPLETLEKLAENASADPQAAAHLASCSHCQTELSMLKSFQDATPSSGEGAAVAWIAAQLERQQSAPARQSAVARVPFWRTLFRVPYLAGAGAMVAVLVLGISLYKSNPGSGGLKPPVIGDTYRTGEVKLLTPTGDLAQTPAEFRWEPVAGATDYKVELTDVLGKHLATATSSQPQLAVTPEIKAVIRRDTPVNWKVTARDASGKTLAESSGGNFKIR
jgi:hypothetical protein